MTPTAAALLFLLVMSLFILVLVVSDRIGGTRVGAFADWILGTTEPFVHPASLEIPGTADPAPPLRLVGPGDGGPARGVVRGLPDVVVLDQSPASIVERRQRHRNQFCEILLRNLGTVPYPGQGRQWWPGTVPSPAEDRYAR